MNGFMQREQQTEKPCLLCGKNTRNRGVFNPSNPQDFGAKPGKYRAIIYPLCQNHPPTQATLERIEQLIIAELTKGKQ